MIFIPLLLSIIITSTAWCSEEQASKRQKTVATLQIGLENPLITKLLTAVDNTDEIKTSELCKALTEQHTPLGIDTFNTIVARAHSRVAQLLRDSDVYSSDYDFAQAQAAYGQPIERAKTQYRNLPKELCPLLNHPTTRSMIQAILAKNLESIQTTLNQSPSLAFCSVNILVIEELVPNNEEPRNTLHAIDILTYVRMFLNQDREQQRLTNSLILNHRRKILSSLTRIPDGPAGIVVQYAGESDPVIIDITF